MVEIDSKEEKLRAHLEDILDSDLYKNKEIKYCPHCHSKKIIKHGSYKHGQRFLCKECRRTFCKRTLTPLYRTKKSVFIWSKYIDLMLTKTTLRKSSNYLNISISTAFYWRHKILHSLVKITEQNRLMDLIHMIKIFTKESYKGDRNAPEGERKKVWTILATDVSESILARPISIGKWDKKNFDTIIYSRINSTSYLYTFSDRYLHNIAEKHNRGKQKIKRIIFNTLLGKYLKDVQFSLKKFNGVATKYLTHYLYFSSIYSVEKKYDAISLIYKIGTVNTYIANKDMKEVKAISC